VYGVFAARDGSLVIAAQVDDAWRRLALLIGGPALEADTRFHGPEGRNANRREILALITAWTKARPVDECIAALESAAVPCSPVQNIDTVIADPQIAARNMIVEQAHPVLGTVRLANVPIRFSDCDTTPRCAAPLMGQHNREIAAGLGFPESEIEAMVRDGVLHEEDAARRLHGRSASGAHAGASAAAANT
jgi:crotonobetainyl-CoA:carnitine CoA-transferase CaiB-like acyl-CoA transferase